MVFVHLTDENTLIVYSDEQEAVRACEGIDVEDGSCVFYGSKGEPLRAVFDEPNQRGSFVVVSGQYHLTLEHGQRQNLADLLPQILNIEGPCALHTLQDVQRLLTAQCTGQAPSAAPAGNCER